MLVNLLRNPEKVREPKDGNRKKQLVEKQGRHLKEEVNNPAIFLTDLLKKKLKLVYHKMQLNNSFSIL
jgi:hypothetical protein